jgi:cytochrome c peroxidase
MTQTRTNPLALALLAAPFALGAAMFAAPGWQRGSNNLPPVPVPDENPITEDKRLLGKALFYDEQLSTDNTVSCATCHWHPAGGAEPNPARHPGFDALFNTEDDVLGSAGVIAQDEQGDYRAHPVFGLEPQVTRRAAPSVINAAFAPELFWDTRAGAVFADPVSGDTVIPAGAALESQAVDPPLDSAEMAHHGRDWPDITGKLAHARPMALASDLPPDIAAAILDARTYPELFRRAFGDNAITPARIAMALATYQRTLISDQSPWDDWNNGDSAAMTDAQIRGFDAFLIGSCVQCHPPTQFTNHFSRNIGLRPVEEDMGLAEVTGNEFDAGRFKTPGLRNGGLKESFMHHGAIATMEEVVDFYVVGKKFPENLDPAVTDIQLTEQERADLTDFMLNALTDARVVGRVHPFDVPTLFFDPDAPTLNPAQQPGTGRPLSSGAQPRMIAITPPLIGTDDFKVGLTDVPEGAQAVLHISFNAPVNGQVAPDTVLGPFTATHPDGLAASATAHWPIPFSPILDGRTVHLQWVIDDPGASEPALSPIASATFFCGFGNCATGCLADLNRDQNLDFFDIAAYLTAYNAQAPAADLAEPLGAFNFFDLAAYLAAYNAGCP